MSASRSMLLVGEGNFSFSASLSRFYSETETSITASCLQPQEEALRHEGAAHNVQIIRDSGGAVLFGVDCTKLGDCASLQGRVFDRVVFNFPHCGRKSGVKKNRELLKNFFLSCVQVLGEDGEVHVSLCNGQGGTPADHPKREWHNSWQVAAMAAEAHLILTDVLPFESDKYESYKCTGYSLPYTSARILKVEEVVEGERVQYNVPAELSDYIFRGFLCSGSVHPVKLVQDFLLKGLAEKWSVSMTTETVPFLLTAEQLQTRCRDVDSTHCYWIQLLQKDLNSDAHTFTDKAKDQLTILDTPSATCVTSHKVDRARSKGAESLRSARSLDVDPEEESGLYMLRPSLLPHSEALLFKKEELINNAGDHEENEGNNKSVEVGGLEEEGPCGGCNGVTSSLYGISGLVFRNVPVNLWALPALHEFLLRGVFPSDGEPVKLLGQCLETLLAPHGVSLVAGQGGLRKTPQTPAGRSPALTWLCNGVRRPTLQRQQPGSATAKCTGYFWQNGVSFGNHPQLCCCRQQDRTARLNNVIRLAPVFIHPFTATTDQQQP